MKHLALIESPFHLICLSEAVTEMEIAELDVMVITAQSSRNYAQLEYVKSFYSNLKTPGVNWYYGDTDTVQGSDLHSRIALYAEIYNKLRHHDYRSLILSDFRSQWQKDIAATCSAQEKWLLDDGTATLAYCYYHLPRGRQFSLPKYGSQSRIQEAKDIKRKLGLALGEVGPLHMFTMFGQHVPATVKSLDNPLTGLKTTFKNLAENNTLIIGAKILERDFCSVRDYHAFIRRIIAEAGGDVMYVPHRGQSAHFNEALAEAFPQLHILYIESPLELWFYNQTCPPAHVCGFVSTFFYVAAQSFPQLKLTCYAPTESILRQADKAGVYGSDCFTNSEAITVNFECLPAAVGRRFIEAEVGEGV